MSLVKGVNITKSSNVNIDAKSLGLKKLSEYLMVFKILKQENENQRKFPQQQKIKTKNIKKRLHLLKSCKMSKIIFVE